MLPKVPLFWLNASAGGTPATRAGIAPAGSGDANGPGGHRVFDEPPVPAVVPPVALPPVALPPVALPPLLAAPALGLPPVLFVAPLEAPPFAVAPDPPELVAEPALPPA